MEWYFFEVLPVFVVASVVIWVGQITGLFPVLVEGMKPAMAVLGLPGEAAVVFLFGFFRRDYGAAGLYDLAQKGDQRHSTRHGGGDADPLRALRGAVLGNDQGARAQDGDGHRSVHFPVGLGQRFRSQRYPRQPGGDTMSTCQLLRLFVRPGRVKTNLPGLSLEQQLRYYLLPSLWLQGARRDKIGRPAQAADEQRRS